MKPVIGVLCCNDFHERPIQAVASRFIEPLSRVSNATVLLVPALIDVLDAQSLCARLDGLLLTGSRSNVGVECYGGDVRQEDPDSRLDAQRDQVALRLAGQLIEAGRPVFGICRGLQELNVLFGGTLQNVDHHHMTDYDEFQQVFTHEHQVQLDQHGRLFQHIGRDKLNVNSVHYQAVDRLGYGLQLEATSADDNIVEAFSARPNGGAVMAVQWHPEWQIGNCPEKQAFFEMLGQELVS